MLMSMKAKWQFSGANRVTSPSVVPISLFFIVRCRWQEKNISLLLGTSDNIDLQQKETLLRLSCLGKVTYRNTKSYLRMRVMPPTPTPSISSDFQATLHLMEKTDLLRSQISYNQCHQKNHKSVCPEHKDFASLFPQQKSWIMALKEKCSRAGTIFLF